MTATVALDEAPSAVASTRGHVWIGSRDGSDILGINPKSNAVDVRIARLGTEAMAVDLNSFLYACSSSDTAKIDPETSAVIAVFSFGCTTGLTIDDRLETWLIEHDRLIVLDPDGHLLATTPLASNASSIASGAGSIWVTTGTASSAVLMKIDPSNRQIVATIPIASAGRFIVATDAAIWVTTSPSSTADATSLVRVDPTTNTITDGYTEAGDATGIDLSGAHIWVTDATGHVFIIDSNTHQIVERLKLMAAGTAPRAAHLVAANGSIWITTQHPNAVQRVDPGSFGYIVDTDGLSANGTIRVDVAKGCPRSVAGGAEFSSTAAVFIANPDSAGLATAFVPGTPTAALICRYSAAEPIGSDISASGITGGTLTAARTLAATDATALADSRNDVIPSDITSACLFADNDARYTAIVFAIPHRADVDVWLKDWIGCPEVSNGTHSSGELIDGNGATFIELLNADLPTPPPTGP